VRYLHRQKHEEGTTSKYLGIDIDRRGNHLKANSEILCKREPNSKKILARSTSSLRLLCPTSRTIIGTKSLRARPRQLVIFTVTTAMGRPFITTFDRTLAALPRTEPTKLHSEWASSRYSSPFNVKDPVVSLRCRFILHTFSMQFDQLTSQKVERNLD
jgi:hypothetical protein